MFIFQANQLCREPEWLWWWWHVCGSEENSQ